MRDEKSAARKLEVRRRKEEVRRRSEKWNSANSQLFECV